MKYPLSLLLLIAASAGVLGAQVAPGGSNAPASDGVTLTGAVVSEGTGTPLPYSTVRLMPIGQTDAHRLLSRTLESVPAVVDRIAAGEGHPESFTPMMDIAAMTQQYLHSRLFRS